MTARYDSEVWHAAKAIGLHTQPYQVGLISTYQAPPGYEGRPDGITSLCSFCMAVDSHCMS